MRPGKLKAIVQSGVGHKYKKGDIIYSLDFDGALYYIDSGYIRRSSVREVGTRSVQAIYGPGYLFPLTIVFNTMFGRNISQEHTTYFYEAISDVEVHFIKNKKLLTALKTSPDVDTDILYEAARRLQSNVHRMENVSYESDYKKVAHQLAYLAEEFGEDDPKDVKAEIKILFPLTPADISEQLSLKIDSVAKAVTKLQKLGYITQQDDYMYVNDMNMLKDVYL